MKIRYYLMALLLPFATLLTHAAITGVSPMTTLTTMAAAVTRAGEAPLPLQGPGLGNLTYTSAELFKPVSMITRASGDVPATYPGRKDYGLNVGIMLNGYFLTSFAPDSGLGPGGFLLYDVSNPRAIVLVKKIYEPEGRTKEFREAHAFGTAKINGRQYVVVPSIKGIEFWDFTDINNIQQVKKLSLPTVNGGDYANVAWQLWWQTPYVYVASANDGVYIVDASDPANAVIANRGAGKPNPVPTGELGGFRVGPIFTMGNHMVLTSMDNTDGFASLDISDPLNPKVLDTVGSNPNYYATCFDGRNLHASARGGGAKMYSYDLSDRLHVSLGGRYTRDDKDASVLRLLPQQHVGQQRHGLDVAACPARVVERHGGQSIRQHGSRRLRIRTDEREGGRLDRRRREQVVAAMLRAARHLQVDELVGHTCGLPVGDQAACNGQPFVARERVADAQLGQRTVQPHQLQPHAGRTAP